MTTTKKTKQPTKSTDQAAADADAKTATAEQKRLTAKARNTLLELANAQDRKRQTSSNVTRLRVACPYRDLAVALMVRLHPLQYSMGYSHYHTTGTVLTLMPERWPHLQIQLWGDGEVQITNVDYWKDVGESYERKAPAFERNHKPFYRKNFYTTPTDQAVATIMRWLTKNGEHFNLLVAGEIIVMENAIAERKRIETDRWIAVAGDLPRPAEDNNVSVHYYGYDNAELRVGEIRVDSRDSQLAFRFTLPPHLRRHLTTITAALNDLRNELMAMPADAANLSCSVMVLNMDDYKIEPEPAGEHGGQIITILPVPED